MVIHVHTSARLSKTPGSPLDSQPPSTISKCSQGQGHQTLGVLSWPTSSLLFTQIASAFNQKYAFWKFSYVHVRGLFNYFCTARGAFRLFLAKKNYSQSQPPLPVNLPQPYQNDSLSPSYQEMGTVLLRSIRHYWQCVDLRQQEAKGYQLSCQHFCRKTHKSILILNSHTLSYFFFSL